MSESTSPLMAEIPGNFSPMLPPQMMNERPNDSLSLDVNEQVPIVTRQFVFIVDALQTFIDRIKMLDFGFNAKSIKVDNASAGWYYIVQAGQYIAPWQIGAVINLTPGGPTLNIQNGAPGAKNQTFVDTQRITITAYSINQWPCPGFSAQAAP